MEKKEHKLSFHLELMNLRATHLVPRHRFKEKLRIRIGFDNVFVKTEKRDVVGPDLSWKFHWNSEWTLVAPTAIWTPELAKKELIKRHLFMVFCCQHNCEPLGKCSANLWTIATGPVDHNLPILNTDGKEVGRFEFSMKMEQLTEVICQFQDIKVLNLRNAPGESVVNPYLKYAFSKHWLEITSLLPNQRAIYAETKHKNYNPEWRHLPTLRFRTSLNEMSHESIVVHVNHRGSSHNTNLGRCNLVFRTLVEKEKDSFAENDLIEFRGPLQTNYSGATIEGHLVCKSLPCLGQMKSSHPSKRAVHTEKGIVDAIPLLPWLPLPDDDLLKSEVIPKNSVAEIERDLVASEKQHESSNASDESDEPEEQLPMVDLIDFSQESSPMDDLRQEMMQSLLLPLPDLSNLKCGEESSSSDELIPHPA